MADPQKPSTDYEQIADKVGLVPNVRKKDNVYQGLAVLGTTVVGVIAGSIWAGWPMGALLGAVGGLVVGGLASGLVLMFVGLARK